MYCCWELGVIAVGLNCYLRNVKGYLGRGLCKEKSLQKQYHVSVCCKRYSNDCFRETVIES